MTEVGSLTLCKFWKLNKTKGIHILKKKNYSRNSYDMVKNEKLKTGTGTGEMVQC